MIFHCNKQVLQYFLLFFVTGLPLGAVTPSLVHIESNHSGYLFLYLAIIALAIAIYYWRKYKLASQFLNEKNTLLANKTHELNENQKITHIGSWHCDLLTQRVILSTESYRILGIPPVDYLRRDSIWDYIHPEDKELLHKVFTKELFENHGYTISYRIIRPDGQVRHIRERTQGIINNDVLVASHGTLQDITESVIAKQNLHDSQLLLQGITNASPHIIALSNIAENKILYRNRSLLEMLGYQNIKNIDAEDELSKSLIHPDDFSRLIKFFNRIKYLKFGDASDVEFRMKAADDTWRWIRRISSKYLDDDIANVDKFVSIFEDITDRKNSEKEIRESEEKFRSIAENIPGVVYMYKVSPQRVREPIYAGPGVEKLIGTKTANKIGNDVNRFFELVPDEDLEGLIAASEHAERDNKALDYAYRVRLGNDRYKWIRSISKGTLQDNGDSIVLGVLIDITSSKNAEKLQTVLYNITNVVNITDNLEEVYTHIHRYLGNLINTKNFYIALYDEVTDEIYFPYHVDHVDTFERIPAKGTITGYLIKNNLPIFASERQINEMAQAGKINLVGEECKLWMGVPLTVSGKTIGAVVVQSYDNEKKYTVQDLELLTFISDATAIAISKKYKEQELLEAKERAEAANNAKTQFLANMSHEIRTPLNAVMGFAKLLLFSDLTDQQREHIFLIKDSSVQLMEIVEDILDLAKIESCEVKLYTKEFHITQKIEKIIQSFSPTAEKKNILLTSEIDANIPLIVKADYVKIRQIISNLLSNALKFTAKGTIKLTLRAGQLVGKSLTLTFSVIDSGVGIPKKDQAKIFNRFYQQDASHTRKFGGAGLGLTICQELVTIMGGTITVDSLPGQGSSFTFQIPVELVDDYQLVLDTPSNDEVKKIPKEVTGHISILLAEDNIINQKIIVSYAKSVGWQLDIAVNGEKAILACADKHYDILMMDERMPGMNGIEAARILKANKATAKLPIILFSAYQEKDLDPDMHSVVDAFLAKPIDFDLLAGTVKKLLT